MAEKYRDRIEVFCNERGISIPPGFYRHPASRYVSIDMEATPPKLVAKTWSKQEDAAYYLARIALRSMRMLDFKDRQELRFNGQNSFPRGSEF